MVLPRPVKVLRFLRFSPPEEGGLWVLQEVTLGLKCSQTRTAMMVGTVTTRVLMAHTAKLGCTEDFIP